MLINFHFHAATWELSVGVQGAFLTTSSTGNVFATVRCGRQYHKTAVRALVRGEVVWDEPFDLQFGPGRTPSPLSPQPRRLTRLTCQTGE